MTMNDVMNIIANERPPVRGFYYRAVDRVSHIAIVIFKDNFTSLAPSDQKIISDWIGLRIISRIRELGYACYVEVYDTFGGKRV